MNEIKMAKDIIKEIEHKGKISVPNGYVTGEAFEKWLYELNIDKICLCNDYDEKTGICKYFQKYCDCNMCERCGDPYAV